MRAVALERTEPALLSPVYQNTLLGLLAPSATEMVAGEPDGPVTVAPVSDELTLASLSPNTDPATSSLTATVEPDAAGMTRRPSPLVPSARLRSAITCLRPAWDPLPLRI